MDAQQCQRPGHESTEGRIMQGLAGLESWAKKFRPTI
jgi:hypothetical protein